MNKKHFLPILILAAVIVGALLLRPPTSAPPGSVADTPPSPQLESPPTDPAPVAEVPPVDPVTPGALPPGVPMPQPPPSAPGDRFARPVLENEPDPDLAIARNDTENIGLMLRDFRTVQGENPTGTNAEIMKAIMGGNKKGAQLGPPTGMALNQDGELVDRWGTPFFFHAQSGNEMEVRSAGPDRKLYTSDDVIGK
jgi:hypothetical protein